MTPLAHSGGNTLYRIPSQFFPLTQILMISVLCQVFLRTSLLKPLAPFPAGRLQDRMVSNHNTCFIDLVIPTAERGGKELLYALAVFANHVLSVTYLRQFSHFSLRLPSFHFGRRRVEYALLQSAKPCVPWLLSALASTRFILGVLFPTYRLDVGFDSVGGSRNNVLADL